MGEVSSKLLSATKKGDPIAIGTVDYEFPENELKNESCFVGLLFVERRRGLEGVDSFFDSEMKLFVGISEIEEPGFLFSAASSASFVDFSCIS